VSAAVFSPKRRMVVMLYRAAEGLLGVTTDRAEDRMLLQGSHHHH
jgi:hypothetical protein